MKQLILRRWLSISVVGSAALLGCSHARHHCDCEVVAQPAPALVRLPGYAPQPGLKRTAQAPVQTTSAKDKTEGDVKPAAAKTTDPARAAVLATVVAPGSMEGGSPPLTGTMALTAAEAEALGIRPGYTPGAMFAPADSGTNPAQPVSDPKDETPDHSANSTSAKPAEGTE